MASWLFGSRSQPEDFSQYVPPSAGGGSGAGGDDDKKIGHNMEAYRFDSSALERAAKAAKDLEKSSFAQQALELSKYQEETKQKEIIAKAKEFELQIEHTKLDGKRVAEEQRRKTLQEQAKLDQQKAQYQDQLARRRYEDQLLQQQRINEENLRKQEESVAKQEAMRRATIEQEFEKKMKYDLKQQEAQIKAMAKVERENQDLKLEQIKLKAEQDRETTLKSIIEKRETTLSSISTITSAIGTGLNSFLSDPKKIAAAVGGGAAMTTAYFATKGSFGILFRFIEARIAKPVLVKDTSRIVPIDFVRQPFKTLKKLKRKSEDVLSGVILSPQLEERVRDIAIGTKNTKYNRGMYRNVLLYGPPGTGKTLFAKKLAMHSGMDYAIITGGDIAQLGKDGVASIHKVFDWAESSRKGLILFIDEAEGFLTKRHGDLSEDLRMALNAFLYRTGTQTDKFMIVLASNTPERLDLAVIDRIHEPVNFPLPTLEERERLVRLYFEKYVLDPATKGKRRLKVADFDFSQACSEVARMTEGLSAREITNLALDWQMTTYASLNGVLTRELMIKRAESSVDHKKHKITWFSSDDLKRNFSKAVIDAAEAESKKS